MARVKDLKRYLRVNNVRLLPALSTDMFEFMSEYNTYANIYDEKLHDYDGLHLMDVDEVNAETFADIQAHIKMKLFMNKYKYNELYKTLFYEYNPLNNTEWKETQTFGQQHSTDVMGERITTDEHGQRAGDTVNEYGEQLTTNVTGEREQTNAYGAHEDTHATSYGATSETDVIATRTNSDEVGAQTNTDAAYIDTTSHTSNGYDSNTGVPDGKDVTEGGQRSQTIGGHTDTHTLGGGTDTHSAQAHTDTVTDTYAAHTDIVSNEEATDTTRVATHTDILSHSEDEYTDKSTQSAATDTHTANEYVNTIERAGNIGVTTSAQLINEQRGVVDWSFWEILYNDIIDEICLSVW